jgi:hypothetical protein
MSDLMQAPANESLGGEETEGTNGKGRVLALLGILAGVVVIGLAAFFLFFSGGSEEDLGPVPSAGGNPSQPADTGKDDGSGEGQGELPPEYDGVVGRDPFQPLAAEEVVPPPAPKPSAQPSSGNGGNPEPNPGPTSSEQPSEPSGTTAYRVTFVGVDGAVAIFDVNGKTTRVKQGKLFPSTDEGPFKLLALSEDPGSGDPVATIVFGSETPENLGQGDSKTYKP